MSDKMQTKSQGGLDELVQLVSFKLGKEEFGIDILQVQEINRMVEITQIPDAPSYVEGIINLRDKVIPVIDLRKKLGLEATEHCKETRIVVMDVNGRMTGMIVDSVSEVLRAPKSTIEPPPQMVNSVNADYLSGVVKLEGRLLILLDISKIAGEVHSAVDELAEVAA